MALTKRGQMIYQYFVENPTIHPSAEEIYQQLKKTDTSIGVATVYRNLKTLVEAGLVREINLEKQGVRYDLYDHEHAHFICDSCGNIHNIQLDQLSLIQKEIMNKTKGIITRQSLLFHGICEHCKS